jgi:hypothetical protein
MSVRAKSGSLRRAFAGAVLAASLLALAVTSRTATAQYYYPYYPYSYSPYYYPYYYGYWPVRVGRRLGLAPPVVGLASRLGLGLVALSGRR